MATDEGNQLSPGKMEFSISEVSKRGRLPAPLVREAPLDFAHLIHPVEKTDFFQEFWEAKPLHITREKPAYYDKLLSLNDLDEALSRSLLRSDDCALTKGGHYLPPFRYLMTWSKVLTPAVDARKVLHYFCDGYTVVFNAVHRWHPPLNELTCGIRDELGYPAQCNVYVTPPQSTGFTPHFDTHDVIIIQIHGCKKWLLFESPATLPRRDLPKPRASLDLVPERILELTTGDALYLPRGVIHAAESLDVTSAHITLGIHAYTWLDYLGDVLDRTANANVSLRKSLSPVGEIGSVTKGRREILGDLLKLFSDEAVHSLDEWRTMSRGGRPSIPRHTPKLWLGAVHSESITLASRFTVRPLAKEEARRQLENILLRGLAMRLAYPPEIANIISFVVDSRQFEVAAIPGLDDHTRIRLATLLLREGIITLVEST